MATPAPDPPLPGILRLPPAIRRRIYVLVGLGRGYDKNGKTAPTVYNLDGDNGARPPRWGEQYLLFFGLIVSCRAIHDEAAALVYSSNWFVIHRRQRRSLDSLHALTPPAVANLVNLRIVLHQTSCHQRKKQFEGKGDCCHVRMWVNEDPWGFIRTPKPAPKTGPTKRPEPALTCPWEYHWDQRIHDPLIDGSSTWAQALLQQWHAAMASLAPHVTPGALELSVICDFAPDAAGVEAARELLSSLRLLPRLKDCHLRLCGGRNAVLEELAHEAVLYARGISPVPRAPLSEPAQDVPPPARPTVPVLLRLQGSSQSK